MKYSLEGFISVWRKELSFRLEVYISILVLPLIFYVFSSKFEKIVLVLLILLLLMAELLNSAIETLSDRISPEIHPLAKIAKDAGSAAVCIVIIMNIFAWLYLIFF